MVKASVGLHRRIALALAGGLALSTVLPGHGLADDIYPSKSIRLIVPFNAGGAADVVARLVGDSISRRLGQTVIVENRAGATGATGSLAVARSAPDGYTILMAVMSSHAVLPATKKDPAFDPIKDFTPIVRIGNSVQTLVVRKDFPAKDLKGFIARKILADAGRAQGFSGQRSERLHCSENPCRRWSCARIFRPKI